MKTINTSLFLGTATLPYDNKVEISIKVSGSHCATYLGEMLNDLNNANGIEWDTQHFNEIKTSTKEDEANA